MQFKIVLLALFFLTSISACTKDGDIIICTEGTEGLLLDRIENRFKHDTSTVLFFYNQLNVLDSMVHKLRNGESQYKFIYDVNNKLIAKRTSLLTLLPIKISQIIGIDSFRYNSKNQIIEYRGFAKSDSGYSFQNRSIFIYDNKDELEKTISGNDKDTFSISSYFWKDGNIIKTANFSKNMILKHEFFFSFDSNKNPYSKIPSYYYTNNMNNTINVKVNDFTGILDYDYFPPREMCYNLQGFLTKNVTDEGEISYFYRNP